MSETTESIRAQLREIYREATRNAELPVVESEGRGVFRFSRTSDRKTKLSSPLLEAFRRSHNLETVLQRTIVDIMHDDLDIMHNEHNHPFSHWFNEFNAAGGWCHGGNAANRFAVDLGRVIPVERQEFSGAATLSRYKVDFFELKQWNNSADSPDYAAFELFKVFAAYWSLVCRGDVSPYQETLANTVGVRLCVIAPENYYRHWNCRTTGDSLRLDRRIPLSDLWLYKGNRFFIEFYEAFNDLKNEFFELRRVTFHPHAVVLKDIDADEFVEVFFDWETIDVRSGADCPSAILKNGAADTLRQWVNEALNSAYLDTNEETVEIP